MGGGLYSACIHHKDILCKSEAKKGKRREKKKFSNKSFKYVFRGCKQFFFPAVWLLCWTYLLLIFFLSLVCIFCVQFCRESYVINSSHGTVETIFNLKSFPEVDNLTELWELCWRNLAVYSEVNFYRFVLRWCFNRSFCVKSYESVLVSKVSPSYIFRRHFVRMDVTV